MAKKIRHLRINNQSILPISSHEYIPEGVHARKYFSAAFAKTIYADKCRRTRTKHRHRSPRAQDVPCRQLNDYYLLLNMLSQILLSVARCCMNRTAVIVHTITSCEVLRDSSSHAERLKHKWYII